MTTPIRQLDSLTSYTADGTTTVWNFSFSGGYLDPSHVKAYTMTPAGVRTELTITPAMLTGTYQLTVSPPVTSGYELTIYRGTPTNAPMVNFADRAAFTEVSMDTSIKQSIFAAAETADALSVATERLASVSAYAQQATDAATASANSATSASNSATAAGNSATAAYNSATAAQSSADAAAATAASFNDANIVHKAGAETITGVKTFSAQPVGIVKGSVGLGNVDNTSDVSKPVSTAQAAAIATTGGFKNRVRNPKMTVAQRGNTFTSWSNGAAYFLDGWRWAGGSVTGTVSPSWAADVAATSEAQKSLRITTSTAQVGVAAGVYALVQQPIEGYLVRDMVGNPIAIRFEVRSPKSGQHYVSLQNSAGDRSYILPYTVTTANTWQTVTLSLPGGLITAGTWDWQSGIGVILTFPLVVGSTYQSATTGAWVSANVFAGTGQQNLLDTVGNIFAITAVQMERDRGQGATAFEHRDPATEDNFCARYYQRITLAIRAYAAVAGAIFSNPFTYQAMRASPTISLITAGGVSGTTSSVSVIEQSSGSARIEIVSNAIGDTYTTGRIYDFSAEL